MGLPNENTAIPKDTQQLLYLVKYPTLPCICLKFDIGNRNGVTKFGRGAILHGRRF